MWYWRRHGGAEVAIFTGSGTEMERASLFSLYKIPLTSGLVARIKCAAESNLVTRVFISVCVHTSPGQNPPISLMSPVSLVKPVRLGGFQYAVVYIICVY